MTIKELRDSIALVIAMADTDYEIRRDAERNLDAIVTAYEELMLDYKSATFREPLKPWWSLFTLDRWREINGAAVTITPKGAIK